MFVSGYSEESHPRKEKNILYATEARSVCVYQDSVKV